MHKRRLLIRGAPALRLRLLRLRSIHPTSTTTASQPSSAPSSPSISSLLSSFVNFLAKLSKYVKYCLRIIYALLLSQKSKMGNVDRAKIVVYIEFGFLGLGTMVAGILILFPAFFLDVLLQEIQDEDKREHLRGEIGTLTTIGTAVIAIALLLWLIVVLTLCQGVRGISPSRLLVWLIINGIPTVLGIGFVTFLLVLNPDTYTMHIPSIGFLLYKVWSIWVVSGLRRDIRTAGPSNNFHTLQQHHRQSRSYSTHSHHSHCQS